MSVCAIRRVLPGTHSIRKGLQPHSKRVQAVSEYPSLKEVSQLKTFLGMAGYYRRFIPNFSDTAAPLYDLLKKKPFEWSVNCEKAFTAMRQKMATRPVMSFQTLAYFLSYLCMLVR